MSHRVRWAVVGLTLFTVVIGLWGMHRDLPYPEVDEPTFVRSAVHIAATGDPNPHWFGHPGSTVIYPLAIVFHADDVIAHGGSLFGGDPSMTRRFQNSPGEFYLLGRLLILAYSAGCVLLLFAVGRRAFGTRVALIGTFLWVLVPLAAWYGDIVRTDLAATFFGLVGLWCCLRVLDEPTRRNYILAGAAVGVAIATRYFMVALIPALLVAIFIATRHDSRQRAVTVARAGALSLLATFGAFALTTPYFFLDFATAQRTLADQSKPHLGNDGLSPLGNFAFYMRTSLPHNLTLPIALLALAGIALIVRRPSAPRALLLLFVVTFMAAICSTPLHWDRWTLQIIPVLLLFAAYAGTRTVEAVRARSRVTSKLVVAVGFAALGALTVSPAVALVNQQQLLSKPSTRTLARDWIVRNVPRGTRIGIEIKTAPLDRTGLRVLSRHALGSSGTVDFYEDHGYRFLLVNGHVRDVYRAHPRRYPREAAFYRTLARDSRLRRVFRPSRHRAGSTILIYEFPRD